jgi:hypothetical protein
MLMEVQFVIGSLGSGVATGWGPGRCWDWLCGPIGRLLCAESIILGGAGSECD